MRDIGPGAFSLNQYGEVEKAKQAAYLLRNGDLRLVANLEYRAPLFGRLKGAVFLDAGNVWRLQNLDIGEIQDYIDEGMDEKTATEHYNKVMQWIEPMKFKTSRFFEDIALGTGIGLRYDLGFLVIRLDWGIALHTPYDTGKSGYFNINSFKDAQALHFAIGYPF